MTRKGIIGKRSVSGTPIDPWENCIVGRPLRLPCFESGAGEAPALQFPRIDAFCRPLPSAALALLLALGALFGLTSCATVPSNHVRMERLAMAQQIAAEAPGNYFVGRRYFKANFRFWGYIRRPQQPWNSAVLVMLNENKKLAPDRAVLGRAGTGDSYEDLAGFDNNYEYKLSGHFSGDKVYEPASNSIYPEFVLTNYELRSKNPPPIFPSQINGQHVSPYVIEKPE